MFFIKLYKYLLCSKLAFFAPCIFLSKVNSISQWRCIPYLHCFRCWARHSSSRDKLQTLFSKNLQLSEEDKEMKNYQYSIVTWILTVSPKWSRVLNNSELVLHQIQPPQGINNKNKHSSLVGEVFRRCLFSLVINVFFFKMYSLKLRSVESFSP